MEQSAGSRKELLADVVQALDVLECRAVRPADGSEREGEWLGDRAELVPFAAAYAEPGVMPFATRCAKRWWVPAAVGRVARSPIGGPIPEVFGVSQVCRWRRKASVDVAGFRLGLRRWSGTGSPTIRREVQCEFVGWVEPTFPRVYVGDIARPALT